jgi:hypothetical protein
LHNSPIRLGPINLRDFEIPHSVRFGGRQRLTVHTLAGGRRIVERLGPDDSEIQFEGIFSGPAAVARAQAFDTLRLSGQSVWLTWESFRRQVIVKSFVADYHSPWWIPYQVSCVVVHQARIAAAQASNVIALLSADLSAAMSAAAGSTISLTSLRTVLSNSNAATIGTADQIQASTTVRSTLTAINAQMDQQSATLISPIAPGTNPSDLGQMYISRLTCAASLAALVNMRSYIGRIGANIAGTTT